MGAWPRALIVPLIAVALWLIPSDRPGTEVAGAVEIASLADAAPTAAPTSLSATSSSPTSSSPTSSSPTSSSPTSSESTTPLSTAPTTTSAVVTSTTGVPATTGPATTVASTTIASTTTEPATTAPTTTASTTTASTTTTTPSLSLGEQALARVAFDWRTAFPEWTVEFRGPRNGIRALTYPGEKRIEIFVRSSDTAETLHRVFAHELGHVIDVERNSDEDRARWLTQRGVSTSMTWWPNAESPDFATGAGDFAEAFAVWETGVTTRSTVAGQPTGADLDLLRELSRG